MRKLPMIILLAACAVGSAWQRTEAGDTGRRLGDSVEEGAKTGGRAVRDGALTFGRTTRAFFKGGKKAARETWNANARHTAEDARAGGRAGRDAAHEGEAKSAE
jgi:hypothetical protein